MKFFTLLWLDGRKQYLTGDTVQQAFTNAGYSAGAVHALDFYIAGLDFYYEWDRVKKNWINHDQVVPPGKVNLYDITVDGVKFIPINVQAIKPELDKQAILFEEVSDECFVVHIHDLEKIWTLKLA